MDELQRLLGRVLGPATDMPRRIRCPRCGRQYNADNKRIHTKICAEYEVQE